MNLPTEIFGDVIVVHGPEDLCEEQADAFTAHITSLDRSRVILDLDSSESIDSAGLEALLESREVLLDLDGDLKVSTTIHANRKILASINRSRFLKASSMPLRASPNHASHPNTTTPRQFADRKGLLDPRSA